MSKVIYCRDLGFDCDAEIHTQTADEALIKASEHAKTEHGLKEITPEVVEKINQVMKEDPEGHVMT